LTKLFGKTGRTWSGKQLAVLLIIFGNFALSITYANFQAFDPIVPKPTGGDFDRYLNIYFGKIDENITPWRILVPMLARLVPDIPRVFFHPNRPELSEFSQAALKFAIVNMFFIVATSVTLYFLILGLGMPVTQGLLGGMLFLGLHRVISNSTMPLVDSGYFFFLTLAMLAVQRQNYWLLLAATLIGVWVKEEVVLWIIPLIILTPFTFACRIRLLASVVPACLLFLVVGYVLQVWLHHLGPASTFEWIVGRWPLSFRSLFMRANMSQLVLSFGLLWVPCFYALLRCQPPLILTRWIWQIPLFLIFTRILGVTNFITHVTSAFPIVIPLALIGLNAWWPQDQNTCRTNT
jgi:hypothetical protein